MSLVWQNVSFKASGSICSSIRRGCCCGSCGLVEIDAKILHDLSGKVDSGELCALMGPSGAGKSTLLKFITQGKNHRGCDGKLWVTLDKKDVKAAFITQDEKDHLLLNLTVYESLHYASELKNPKDMSAWRHKDIVDITLEELELDKIKNNMVGKCSGGERKRIAIGQELACEDKPDFLFLDEPTSGLDSYSGYNVVFLLRKLANTRKMSIITTIHQPSFDMLELFHKVYTISKAGNCIYNGAPDDIQPTLANYNFKCPKTANPADSIIKVASSVNRGNDGDVIVGTVGGSDILQIEMKSMIADEDVEVDEEDDDLNQNRVTSLVEDLKNNRQICDEMTHRVVSEWNAGNSVLGPMGGRHIEGDGLCKPRATFCLKDLWILLKRAGRTSIWRQRKLILIRFALHAIVAGVLTALYGRELGVADGCYVPNDTALFNDGVKVTAEKTLRNESLWSQNVKFQFFSLLFLMFAALMPTVLAFPAEIQLFLNEHRNGWYSTGTYYISKTLLEIPCQFAFPFFYTYLLYWYSEQIGMDTWYGGLFGFMSWRYSAFLWITVLSCFIAQGLGFLIGIICVDSFNITVILSSTILLFLFLFSGFFVKTIQMAASVRWITNLSFIRFSFESLLIVIYGFDRCTYLPGDIGSTVLYIFDLSDSDLSRNIIWLFSHLIVIRVTAYVLLKMKAEPNFLRPAPVVYHALTMTSYVLGKLKPLFSKVGSMTTLVIQFLVIVVLVQLVVGGVLLIFNLLQ